MKRLGLVVIGLIVSLASLIAEGKTTTTVLPRGLQRLVATRSGSEPIRAIAMLDRIPIAADASAARRLGLRAQPLRNLPVMLVEGTVGQLSTLAGMPRVRDVYPDDRLAPVSDDSTGAIGADEAWELGFTGEGIGIAVVDTGIDARHPDLAARVVRNVLVSKQLQLLPDVLFDTRDLPYSNTDKGGHGTLVAGAAAADGSANDYLVGVAPGADLIGYSVGDVAGLLVTEILVAYDDILATKDAYNIRVVNNSFGNGHTLFDPGSPLNVATKAMHDAGLTVVVA
ncbi:MAG: S8 family serine peptidase, partial [Actinomycetota bacterium]